MILKRLYIFIAILLMACSGDQKPTKPKNLIPKDKMASILYEMFVVNSAKGINRKLLENRGIKLEDYILNKFEIDSAQFAESNNYYAHDIKGYQSMMEVVKERINKLKDSLELIEKEEKKLTKKRLDSLKKKTPKIPKKEDPEDVGIGELID